MTTKKPCTLNSVFVTFNPNVTIAAERHAYQDAEGLRDLRAQLAATHVVRRHGDDSVLTIPIVSSAPTSGGVHINLNLLDAPWVAGTLVLDALLRLFLSMERSLARPRPLVMLSTRPDDFLLERAWPNGLNKPLWLERRVAYEFSTRIVRRDDHAAKVLLACDVRTRNAIDATCDELLDAGIDLVGKYVQSEESIVDAHFKPRRNLIGRVRAIDGSDLVLEDTAEGVERIAAQSAYLEPRSETMRAVIHQLAGNDASRVINALQSSSANINTGPDRLRRVRDLFNYLSQQTLELVPGVKFGLTPLLRETSEYWHFSSEMMAKPTMVFDPSGGRTDVWAERGLDSHGPYDQTFFSPKKLRIAVVCQAAMQGQVEQFVYKFFEGMPDTAGRKNGMGRKPYAKGFTRRFALEKPQIHTFLAEGATADDYRRACRDALEFAGDSGNPWNLAIVQVQESFKHLSPNDSPYHVMKAMFMNRDIPVQEVRLESMQVAEHQLTYILNNISLAVYAKLGGTPWLLKADAPIARELVIGVGSHQSQESRIGSPERVVGITTVFSGDGRYLLESRTAAIRYEDYARALLDTLERAVNGVRTEQNWRSTDTIRLIFHTFKPLKNIEVGAIDTLIQKLDLPNTEYAVVHLVDQHPFKVFDENNEGAYYSYQQKKGVMAPERGQMVKLNDSEVLVSFVGSRDVKLPHHGLPTPVLLRLHPESTFRDMTYIARQAFSFACNSWQTFFPARLPITTLYSQIMARQLRSLEEVEEWDSAAMLGRIGRTPWYL